MPEELIKFLEIIKEHITVQKKFDDLTTQKFNEIIDLLNDLENRVKILEKK